MVLLLALGVFGAFYGVDFSFIFNDISNFLTVAVLPGFIAWSSKNLSGHLKQVDFRISETTRETTEKYNKVESGIMSLQKDIGHIRTQVKRMVKLKDTKAFYRRELLNTQNLCLEFMRYNENLFKFASLKGDSFRSFVLDVHDMDITADCVEAVIRLGITVSEEMRQKGCALLGQPFMNAFYEEHSVEVEKFLKDICRIFTDPDNSKHERLQEHSVRFLRQFLSALNKSFMGFQKN